MRCANRTAPVRGGSRGGGARVRVPRLPVWPRRLRWRLVLGFALSGALVQAGLVGVERALLEKMLVLSTQDSLEATVRAGLAGQALAGSPASASISILVNKWIKEMAQGGASRPPGPAPFKGTGAATLA